ncbi:transcription initiation factor TFIID subunit 5-like [Paramacrobiotus metropolitanus]|uniref:transcription initiation factor TFIID subunit 5-like n=1 Tax=Paramacrobiotus metropolitanus TaxID=2943436 RepID=UPI002445FDD8|nr:transcription initiation factor TFIID subunit 5-like [Paramacrobiotus metropolitanus]
MDKETLASIITFLKRRGFKDTEEQLRREAGEELVQAIDDVDFSLDASTFGSAGSVDEPLENESVIHNINKAKVHHGLPKEPDITIPADLEFSEDEDDTEDDEMKERPSKKRKITKKDFFARRFRADPNAPPASRIPFPPLSDLERVDKLNGWKDALKLARLGSDRLPSICCLTLMNSDAYLCSTSLSDDSSLLAAGFSDSKIRLFSLTNRKLRAMKSATDLAEVDPESDDVFERIMDPASATKEKVFHAAHAGSIFASSFSPDKRFLISGCADGSIRLWSLWQWANLVNYKCHMYPVTDVEFSPMGYYFASCGVDRVGRIWATEHPSPLRLLVGHSDDINRITFHPNANYVATAAADRTVRIWDISSGNCVRYFTGHKDVPQALCFSRCGKYLASGGRDGMVHLWDVAMAKEVLELELHTKPVYSLAFSRENTVLASAGHDGMVGLWNWKGLSEQYQADNVSFGASGSGEFLIKSYPTKKTTLFNVHFTRRNILLAVGKFGES